MKIQSPQRSAPAWLAKDSSVQWLIGIGVVIAFLALPWCILRYGYLPDDDALRHAAKAVSGKPWSEILTLRPEISIDHNPGWHQILTAVRSLTGWDARGLVLFSVIGLFLTMALAPLAYLDRWEMWVASLAALSLLFPYFPERLFLGRPLLVTMAATLLLLSSWTRKAPGPPSGKALAGTVFLMALSTWVHGSWYLLVLIPLVFLLAGEWRDAARLAGCWAAGSLLGASATGHPWIFLKESALIPILAFGEGRPEMLVGEFVPFSGSYPALILIAGVLLWRKLAGRQVNGFWRDPVFWLAVLGCLLGFRVVRFWLDWGLPALALWLAREFQELLHVPTARSSRRVVLAAGALLTLFLAVATDREGRWSRYGKFDCLSATSPENAGWLPDPGGILYSVEPSIFYHTFYCNPQGDWRYALGFEATFMRPEDLAVYLELCRTRNAVTACAPWVARMRPADRLVLRSPPQIRPAFPRLEWHYGARDTWIGRLPRSPAVPRAARG